MARRLLVVDDEKDMCDLLQLALERAGHQVVATTSAKAALEIVAQEDIDVVLTDLAMTEMSGIGLCERVLGTQPDIPVIVVTGQSTMDSVIGALRAGAYDFLTKPVDVELLKISVERAISHRRLHEEVKRLRLTTGTETSHELLGQSLAMRRVHDLIGRVATSDASVLVHGETGTGKELIARALH